MDYMHWNRPAASVNPDTQNPVDPRYPMQQPDRENFRAGYNEYLQGLGWNGEQGTRLDFAQGLREQGQHPWMDYWRSVNPNAGQWMGGASLPGLGMLNQQHGPQTWGSSYQAQPSPRPMNPQGIAVGEPNGLQGLADPMRLLPRKQRNPG